jgi:tetratricopeptide (TPR) repeat protein
MNKIKMSALLLGILFLSISLAKANTAAVDTKENPWLFFYTGVKYYEQGSYIDAIPEFNKAVSIKSDLTEAYVYRSLCYEFQNNKKLSKADYLTAIKIEPKIAYAKFGERNLLKGRFKAAISNYTKLIELDPLNESSYFERSQAYIGLKDYNQAMNDINKVKLLNPNAALPYALCGDIYYYLGNYGQAFSEYNKALEIDPDHFFTYVSRGNLYAKLREYNIAIEQFKKALELYPPQNFVGILYFNIAQCYELKGDNQEALVNYQRSLSLDFHGRDPNSRIKAELRCKGNWDLLPEWI